MAITGRKVFVGTKIRRLRRDLDLTQIAMAEDLGISPSYLNLIERNQRPLSAQLLLRLAETFDVDLKDLSGDEDSRAAASLKEVFSDPLFGGLRLGNTEITDLVGASPSAAQAIVTLYRAYRETVTNTAAMAEQLANRDGSVQVDALRFPIEEVRDFFHDSSNHFPQLENAAEALWEDAGLNLENLPDGLRAHLKKSHDLTVKVMPVESLPGTMWRRDRHSRRLFLSEMLSNEGRIFQMALHAGLLGHGELINELVAATGLVGEEAHQICRLGLANYFAGALIMPYQQFLGAAEKLRYDMSHLARRFNASFEQVCHRLTTLQRAGAKGVPFFFVRVDHAGNISKRFSAGGFHFARFGGTCPRWRVHEAFRSPGQILTQIIRLEDQTTYFSISRTVKGTGGGYHLPEQQLAIGMGCKIDYAHKLVYADGLDLTDTKSATPIGVNCRLCERADCNQRAHPPLNRRVSFGDTHRGLSPFTFVQL